MKTTTNAVATAHVQGLQAFIEKESTLEITDTQLEAAAALDLGGAPSSYAVGHRC